MEITEQVPGLQQNEGFSLRITYRGVSIRVLDPVFCSIAKGDYLADTHTKATAYQSPSYRKFWQTASGTNGAELGERCNFLNAHPEPAIKYAAMRST